MSGSERPPSGWLVAAQRDVNDSIVVTIPTAALVRAGLTSIMVVAEAVIKACFLQIPASPPNRWEAIVWDRIPTDFTKGDGDE